MLVATKTSLQQHTRTYIGETAIQPPIVANESPTVLVATIVVLMAPMGRHEPIRGKHTVPSITLVIDVLLLCLMETLETYENAPH